MDKRQVQHILRGVIFFLFGLFDVILLIRLLLRFIGASTESSFVSFWYSLSDTLYTPFQGTITDVGSGKLVLEIDTIVAIFIYFLIAVLAIKIVLGIFKPEMKDKLRSLVDSAFKFTWSLLALRVFFKLIGAKTSSFISLLYGISAPFYKPFEGLLPAIESGRVIIEISTIVAIVIIVILDFASEKLLDELTKGSSSGPKLPQGQSYTPFGSSEKPPEPLPTPASAPPAPAQAPVPTQSTAAPASISNATQQPYPQPFQNQPLPSGSQPVFTAEPQNPAVPMQPPQ